MQLSGITITPTTALAYKSPTITCESQVEVIRFNVTSLTAGQTLQLRIVAIDDAHQAYFHGPARAAISAAQEYSYALGNVGATGGSFPADGQIGLPVPARYEIWVYASDTSGTKPATFNLYCEFGLTSGILADDGAYSSAPVTDISGSAPSSSLPANAAQETGGNLAAIAGAQGAGGTGISQPTGGSGLLGWLSGIFSKVSSLVSGSSSMGLGGSPVNATNPIPMFDAYNAPTSTTWNSSTAANSTFGVNTNGYDTVILTHVPSGTLTGGTVVFEVYDGANWLQVKASQCASYATNSSFSCSGAVTNFSWQVPVAGFPQFRVRLSSVIMGSGSLLITLITSSAPDTSIVTVGIDPGTYGQATKANSMPVTVASDQVLNAVQTCTTFPGSESSSAVTSSAAALTVNTVSNAITTAITVVGANDVYVSPISGGHTWLCPAGATTQIPTNLSSLFAMAVSGSATVYATQMAR